MAKKRIKKLAKKVKGRRKRRPLIGYTIYWPRKRRSQYQIERIIMRADFKKIVRRFKDTNIIKVTYFGTFRRRRYARSFIFRYKVLTVSSLENLLLTQLENIFAGMYDYNLKDKSSVVWRNYIDNIELNFKV